MTKVFINPQPQFAPYGILRVVEAMYQYLPSFDVQPVPSENEADVVNAHAAAFAPTNKPTVYSSHGLYWADHEWPSGLLVANQMMINAMTRADRITAVSQWVAHAISRGILKRPEVIYHGVDTVIWRPGERNNRYVLWNKARADVVSNPAEMQRLAELMPDVGFVTTIGQPARNVQVVGTVPHEKMLDMMQQAGVYLATARETMGIGTLEALACGIPVVGWDHGGQREIITNGYNGYLAKPGDYEALADFTRMALGDDTMRRNARETAVSHWQWPKRIEQYARIFHELAQPPANQHVSIVVTCHDLGKYLPDCLSSVLAQTSPHWDCWIVDDDSKDDTEAVARRFEADGRFHYLRTPFNLKLSGARNYGAAASAGRFLLFLDADDMLPEKTVEILAGALADHPAIHIAYGHLDMVSEQSGERRRGDWPFPHFDWFGQMAHLNQLPYAAMMRREVWEGVGGYRTRDWRAEDASFWCRATSFGCRAAKVTEESTLIYRLRGDSKSNQERAAGHDDGDWTSWLPWRLAGSVKEGMQAAQEKRRPFPAIVPFGAQGMRDDKGTSWPVWSHHDPLVSVVIPVGPGHGRYLLDALDSIQAQTFPFWEAVVINNTLSDELAGIRLPPWARVWVNEEPGIASSRNMGWQRARAPLVLFLDADDMLTPNALYDLVQGYVESDGRYTYGDFYTVGGEKIQKKNSKEYSQRGWGKEGSHPITCLLPYEWVETVGGFDADLPGWEDWDFMLKLVVNGYCGQRVSVPTLVYRLHSGQRREQSLEDGRQTLPILHERYQKIIDGGGIMPCCGGNSTTIIEAKRKLGLLAREEPKVPTVARGDGTVTTVRLEYMGERTGNWSFYSLGGQPLTRTYTFARNATNRFADVPPEDARRILAAYPDMFRVVERPTIDLQQAAVPQVQPPQPPVPPLSEPISFFTPPIPPSDERKKAEETFDFDAILAMNLDGFRQEAVKLGVGELKELKRRELKGKGRKGALEFLDSLIFEATNG